MGLESATFITQLAPGNPVGATDPVSQGDDHLRLLKSVLQATFPNLSAAVNATPAQLNTLVGVTGFAAPANKIGTAVNAAGAAGTWLRSDCTIQLDLALTYAWTGVHSWLGTAVGARSFNYSNTDTGTGSYVQKTLRNNAARGIFELYTASTYSGTVVTSGPSGEQGVFGVEGNFPLVCAQNSIARVVITASGVDCLNGVFDNGARVIDVPRRTSAFARGQCLAVSAGQTLNTSDMAAGYTFSIYNDSAAAITLTQGAGVTLRLNGTTTTGNRTIPARGIATIWCNSGTEAIVSGAVT